MTAIDLEDIVANIKMMQAMEEEGVPTTIYTIIDFYLQGIAKELAKGGDQLTAHKATKLWMQLNKLTSKFGEIKNKAQARDWGDE